MFNLKTIQLEEITWWHVDNFTMFDVTNFHHKNYCNLTLWVQHVEHSGEPYSFTVENELGDIFETEKPSDWPAFDELFGRKNWQQFLAQKNLAYIDNEIQERLLECYDDEDKEIVEDLQRLLLDLKTEYMQRKIL